ncbi:MAG TPA: DUF3618 domain-containing protein [Pseudonocardiaceae bacterium]|nr:DUF3618 domain-containing protein [Pseudonocardiaceae bacterium]
MSSGSEQERLQEEIEHLRGELGETVEALVHKVDVPSRARERASDLKDEATQRAGALKDEALERGEAVKDRAADVLERSCEQVSRVPANRGAMLAGAGIALTVLAVIVRRARS